MTGDERIHLIQRDPQVLQWAGDVDIGSIPTASEQAHLVDQLVQRYLTRIERCHDRGQVVDDLRDVLTAPAEHTGRRTQRVDGLVELLPLSLPLLSAPRQHGRDVTLLRTERRGERTETAQHAVERHWRMGAFDRDQLAVGQSGPATRVGGSEFDAAIADQRRAEDVGVDLRGQFDLVGQRHRDPHGRPVRHDFRHSTDRHTEHRDLAPGVDPVDVGEVGVHGGRAVRPPEHVPGGHTEEGQHHDRERHGPTPPASPAALGASLACHRHSR